MRLKLYLYLRDDFLRLIITLYDLALAAVSEFYQLATMPAELELPGCIQGGTVTVTLVLYGDGRWRFTMYYDKVVF